MSDIRLKVFNSVAKNLSFTKAAADLYISQPAVTKNIKELETEFGLRFFERTGSKISLTKAGKILLDYSNQILDIYSQIIFDLNAIKGEISGCLRLGASTTIGQYILPSILAKFHDLNADIELSLLNANTFNVEQELINKNIDLGIVEGKSKNQQLKYIPFMRDEIVAIVHTSRAVIDKEEITLDELKRLPVILREKGSGSLDVISYMLSKHNIGLNDLNITMHLGSTESIKSYLENADVLGFVSIAAVRREIADGIFRIIDIKDLDISREFYFVHPQGQSGGLAELFMRFTENSITKGYRI